MTDLRTTIAEVTSNTHCDGCVGTDVDDYNPKHSLDVVQATDAILTAVERYVAGAELTVWQYIARTPVFDVPIRNPNAEESYTYYESHYIPPKKFVDEMVAELIAKLNKEHHDSEA